MVAGIGFLVLVVVVAVLITVDMIRTPNEAPAGQADRHAHDADRAIAAPRGGTGAHASARKPARLEIPGPPAVTGVQFGAGPVEVESFDRPDQAARAFDQVLRQETSQSAPGDAAYQAKLNATYLNLSLRSQTLVERQLRLIESLEHGEQDTHRLASLSRLGRIALRMHRNSQNLLVLAGQEQRPGWSQPEALPYLIEAALAEIEDSERVVFEVQPDVAVRGPAVYDTVHVLAELIDNATSFSAANMPVHITGRMVDTGGALIDITDRGIGMAGQELAYANHQLENPPAAGTDMPKWMGLAVVAKLAARHGIRVRLNQADFGGLTALVWLPGEILTRHGAGAEGGQAVPEQRVTPVRSQQFAVAQTDTRGPADPSRDAAWSARSPRSAAHARPPIGRRRSGSVLPGAPGQDTNVILPQAPSLARNRRLPIFDEIESHWSRGGSTPPPAADDGARDES